MKDILVIQNQGYLKSMEFGRNLLNLRMIEVSGKDNGLLKRAMKHQTLRR